MYPLYFSTLDLRRAELVVSSSVAFAKAVRTSPKALHVSYIHTPMRYAWGLDDYLRGSSYRPTTRAAARLIRPGLAAWDRMTARRPDVLVANSETVRGRIRRLWGREARVIYRRSIRASSRSRHATTATCWWPPDCLHIAGWTSPLRPQHG